MRFLSCYGREARVHVYLTFGKCEAFQICQLPNEYGLSHLLVFHNKNIRCGVICYDFRRLFLIHTNFNNK